MKIIVKGTLKQFVDSPVQTQNGLIQKCTAVIKEGEYNGAEKLVCVDFWKERVNVVKQQAGPGDQVEIEAHLKGNFGISRNGQQYATNNVNGSSLVCTYRNQHHQQNVQQQNNQQQNYQNQQTVYSVQNDSDIPF